MSDEEKSLLLKFVTSWRRPPLFGFQELMPPFTIHSAMREDGLPTASTCMNLLKLPEFKTDELMKKQILLAICSETGFELS